MSLDPIHALTVCVHYAHLLRHGLDRWLAPPQVASLTVVTAPGDYETLALCCRPKVRTHVTDAFYRDGAMFDKGGAMEEARRAAFPVQEESSGYASAEEASQPLIRPKPCPCWYLIFDADILPPRDWCDQVKAAVPAPAPGVLHGAARRQCPAEIAPGRWCDDPLSVATLPLIREVEVPGYFWLFHSSDPRIATAPWFTRWTHAGCYDSVFQDRWGKGGSMQFKRRLTLTPTLIHLGTPGVNWCGLGPDAKLRMARLWTERRFRGGRWDHERIG